MFCVRAFKVSDFFFYILRLTFLLFPVGISGRMGLKEKDMKSYIQKAHEKLTREKLVAKSRANGAADVESSEKALGKVSKSIGRVILEGDILN